MTTTLLAIDDSKTMRRVLEITFAGEDYRTVLAESSAEALAKLKSDNPAVALVDAHLGDESGYDLCQKIKREAPGVSVLILSSKQQPYDRARGASAGADDYMDKPFDTQQLIDKVGALLRRAAEAPMQAAKAPAAAPAPQRATAATAPGLGVRPVVPAASPPAAQPHRTATAPGVGVRPLSIPTGGQQPPVAPIQPRPVVAARPAPAPAAAPSPPQPPAAARPPSSPQAAPPPAPARPAAPAQPPPPPPAAPVVSAELPPDLASKLAGLGLTKDQVSGVLALSKDVVEQVVWEVVPMLAEAMIKEEIKRLTSD